MIDKTLSLAHPAGAVPPSLHALMRSSPRQAPVTSGLLILNVLVFALMLVYGAGLWHTGNGVQLSWGANFGPATQDGQWWRLFTALFIHFGIVHLALNMFALWDVGRLVERLYGRWTFALLYLGSGVIGNLLSLVVQGNQAVSGGASGAIFSLYGALLVFLWRERAQVERGEFRWLFGAASAFTVVSLGLGFVIAGIDNSAHIGGLLAGVLWGGVLARPWTLASSRVLPVRWASAVLLVVGVLVLGLRLPEPSYLLGEELKAREAIRAFLSEDQRISQRWNALLDPRQSRGQSFDQLAGRIEAHVTANYEHSFEQLLAATPESAAPSAKTLEALQAYATLRAGASRDMAEGLRTMDEAKFRKALEQARQAQAFPAPAASPASATVRP